MRSPRHEPLTSNRHRSYNGRLEDNVQLVSFHLFTLVLQCSAGLIPFVYSCITNVQLVSFHLFTLVLQMFSWSNSICLLLYYKCISL
jgi:hypothetical protein